MNQVCPSIINSQGELCECATFFMPLCYAKADICTKVRLLCNMGHTYVNLLKFYGDVNVLKNYIRV